MHYIDSIILTIEDKQEVASMLKVLVRHKGRRDSGTFHLNDAFRGEVIINIAGYPLQNKRLIIASSVLYHK